MTTEDSVPRTRPLTVERQPNSPAVLFRDERGVVIGGVWGPSADDMDGTIALARTMAAAELMRAALKAALEQTEDGLHSSPCDVPDCWVEQSKRALSAAEPRALGDGEVQP